MHHVSAEHFQLRLPCRVLIQACRKPQETSAAHAAHCKSNECIVPQWIPSLSSHCVIVGNSYEYSIDLDVRLVSYERLGEVAVGDT